jgi:transcriptional regulator with XRE-family HTH domain
MSDGDAREFDPVLFGSGPEMPPRLALYRVEPLGIGTPGVEDLGSYICRLAHACHVSPTLLCRRILLPRLGFPLATECSEWRRAYFLNTGDAPRRIGPLLEELTGCINLDRLTLVPLTNIIGQFAALTKQQRWCYECLKDMEKKGVVYNRLIWRIQAAEACPTHKALLQSVCDHCDDEVIPVQDRKNLPGICALCGRKLATIGKKSIATKTQIAVSRAIGQLLVDAPTLSNLSREDTLLGVSQFLLNVMHANDLPASYIASRLDCNKSSFHMWLHGRNMPSIGTLARMSVFFGVPIRAIVSGKKCDSDEFNLLSIGAREKKSRRSPMPREKLLSEIRSVCGRASFPLTVNQVAAEIGVYPKTIWSRLPRLARKLSREAKVFRMRRRADELRDFESRCKARAISIASTGRRPTRRLVFDSLRREGCKTNVRLRAICAEVCRAVADEYC